MPEASRDERDLTLQEVVSAADGAVEAASAAGGVCGRGYGGGAGSSAQGEERSGTPRRHGQARGGRQGPCRGQAVAEAREAPHQPTHQTHQHTGMGAPGRGFGDGMMGRGETVHGVIPCSGAGGVWLVYEYLLTYLLARVS